MRWGRWSALRLRPPADAQEVHLLSGGYAELGNGWSGVRWERGLVYFGFMELDRQSIVRSDFPSAGRNGWNQSAVRAHLEAVADAVSAGGPAPGASGSPSLSSHIDAILEAAEAAATEIKREARAEAESIREQATGPAREQRALLLGATQALVARVEEIEAELAGLLADVQTRASVIGAAMDELDGALFDGDPAGALVTPPDAGPAEVPTPAVPASDPPRRRRGGAASASAADAPTGDGPDGADDVDAARLVALDMALGGESRIDIDAYLAAHFELSDRAALLDEVLAAAGD